MTMTVFSSGSSARLLMSSSSSMGHAMIPSLPLVMDAASHRMMKCMPTETIIRGSAIGRP